MHLFGIVGLLGLLSGLINEVQPVPPPPLVHLQHTLPLLVVPQKPALDLLNRIVAPFSNLFDNSVVGLVFVVHLVNLLELGVTVDH